ncbi:MAG: RsmB/NOP family class I SAM-dependent RNA methyltransferase [Myxococcota bacterium]|nr:RsmB/NOP family class I SAM-dependent RNA methyltransferase [Myxococcota bacterium]
MTIDPESRLKEIPWLALAGIAEAVLTGVRRVLEGSPAERVLDRLLRGNRGWTASQRRVAAESVFGVGLWRRRLAAELGEGAWGTTDPAFLLFALIHRLGGLGASEVSQLLGCQLPTSSPADLSDFAVRYSFPDWIADQLRSTFGAAASLVAASMNVPGPVVLRANRLRCTREQLSARLPSDGVSTTPCRFAPDGLVVQGRANLLGTGAHHDGWFEVQDEGSQLLGGLLQARPGDVILDACAGAGGKTLQLASALNNQGTVYAWDPDLEKLRRLEVRAARAGATCVRILWAGIPADLLADRVLVDAPCSELGTLRRGPDVRWRLEPDVVSRMAGLQTEILARSASHLRSGGRLVYGTCTFTREENEAVVSRFLSSSSSDFALRPLSEDPSLLRDGFLRPAPHLHDTDCFFGAVLERG